MSQDDRIFEIATELIRGASMKHDLWRATALASIHPIPPLPVALEPGERILVSGKFAGSDWYAWTTRRLVSGCGGLSYSLLSADTADAEFGKFKGPPGHLADPDAPLESLIATIHSTSGATVRFRYELGYASMAPIQCHKYWTLKHHILHKLMTPSELAEYRKRRQES